MDRDKLRRSSSTKLCFCSDPGPESRRHEESGRLGKMTRAVPMEQEPAWKGLSR
jgi:hypothetical protein